MNFLKSFLIKLIALSRFNKQLIVIINDCLIAIVCIRLSLVTRYETFNFSQENEYILYILAILIFLPIFSYFKIYKIIHQYLGLSSLGQIIIASATSGVVFFFIIVIFQIPYIPRSVGVIYPILFTTIILLSRIIIIYLINESINVINLKNVLIFGVGDTAINAAKVLERSPNYKLKCFIDHKNQNLGKLINNILIYSPENLEILIKKFHINTILVATENFDQKTINSLVTRIEKYNIEIIKIPKNFNILDESSSISDFKKLEIKDLIDREISIKNKKLENLANKVIFVSGAGGSIGSEICKELLQHDPKKIILFDHSEYNLYSVESTLKSSLKKLNIHIETVSRLGSIRDKKLLNYLFQYYRPNLVFHVAAYKHVPIVENNILEAIENNVFGTKNLVEVSIQNKIQNFTLISTDKAVRPTNVMGATKRVAELFLQGVSNSKKINESKIDFSIIRFGNVLGSSGSVVPLFYDQIKEGGPVTVTHEEITRYFMTINEAAILVLQSTSLISKNDIFVLDMGKPIKILNLAKRMIRLSGQVEKDEKHPNGNIEIKFTGLRPGEKLHEELIIGNTINKTENSHILKSREDIIEYEEIKKIIDDLESSINTKDIKKIKLILKNRKIGYNPIQDEI